MSTWWLCRSIFLPSCLARLPFASLYLWQLYEGHILLLNTNLLSANHGLIGLAVSLLLEMLEANTNRALGWRVLSDWILERALSQVRCAMLRWRGTVLNWLKRCVPDASSSVVVCHALLEEVKRGSVLPLWLTELWYKKVDLDILFQFW